MCGGKLNNNDNDNRESKRAPWERQAQVTKLLLVICLQRIYGTKRPLLLGEPGRALLTERRITLRKAFLHSPTNSIDPSDQSQSKRPHLHFGKVESERLSICSSRPFVTHVGSAARMINAPKSSFSAIAMQNRFITFLRSPNSSKPSRFSI